MADSTTDDSNSTDSIDDLEIEMVDDGETGNDSNDSTDDDQTGNDADDLTSDDDATDGDNKSTASKTPAFDADLDEWAEKTGHDKPENDRERKLLQQLRNDKRDFTRDRQDQIAKKLPKVDNSTKSTDDDDIVDPLEKKFNSLEASFIDERTKRMQSEYFQANDIKTEEVETDWKAVLESEAQKGQARLNFLIDPDNIDVLHGLVKHYQAAHRDDTSATAEKAKREERERLAKTSKSAGPTRSAKQTVLAGKKDELVELWESDD